MASVVILKIVFAVILNAVKDPHVYLLLPLFVLTPSS